MPYEVFDYTKYPTCSVLENTIVLNRAAYEALADNDAPLHVELLFNQVSYRVGIRRSKPGPHTYEVSVNHPGEEMEERLIHAEEFIDFYKLGEEGDISAVMSDGILSFLCAPCTQRERAMKPESTKVFERARKLENTH